MSRSKRKRAAQAAVNADFAKKKAKLGRKARPDNLTNTAVSARQILVPNQSRAPSSAAPQALPSHTGLSLPDLQSRAAHHNVNARTAALNALSNALVNSAAAAHAALAARPAAAVSAAATALCDPDAPVRNAAAALAVAALSAVPDPSPLLPPLAPALTAALTHVRMDIRVSAARAVPQLLAVGDVSPDVLFRGSPPLPALSDLLAAATLPQPRTDVLAALMAIVPDAQSDPVHGYSKPASTRSSVAHEPTRDPTRPFYFHARVPARVHRAVTRTSVLPTDPLEVADADALDKLFVRVSNAVTEALPPQHPATVLTAACALLPRLQSQRPGTVPVALTHALTSAARYASALPVAAALSLATVALRSRAKSAISTPLLRRAAVAHAAPARLAGLLGRAPSAAAADLRASWAAAFAKAANRGDADTLLRYAALLPVSRPLPSVALEALPDALRAAPKRMLPSLVDAALAVSDVAALQACLAAALRRDDVAPAAVARLAARAAARDVLLCDEAAVAAVLGAVVSDTRAQAAAPLADALEWAIGQGVAGRETRVRAVALHRAATACAQKRVEADGGGDAGASGRGDDVLKDGAAERLRVQVRRIAEAALRSGTGSCAV